MAKEINNNNQNNLENNITNINNKDFIDNTHNLIQQEINIIPEIPNEIKEQIKKIQKGSVGLIVLKGPIIGEKFYLKKSILKIGRSNDSDILLDDITVSRNHAIIRKINKHFEIEDLNSLNGTYINGDIINNPVILKNLDRIQIGKYIFIFFNF